MTDTPETPHIPDKIPAPPATETAAATSTPSAPGNASAPPAANDPAPSAAVPSRKPRWWLRIPLAVLLIALGVAGGLAYDAWRFLRTPASGTPQDVIISIAPGATFDRVAYDLKKAGAITDVVRFRLLGKYKDSLGKIKAGEFLVNTGWTPEQVLLQLTNGQALLYKLSIREGLTWWETARAVEAQGFATFEDFKAVIHDPAFLKAHDIPFANAEGFLFPETYMLRKPKALDRAQAEAVAGIMIRMFWKKTAPLWQTLPPREGVALTAPESTAQSSAPTATAQPSAPANPPAANGTADAGTNAAHSGAAADRSTDGNCPAPGNTAANDAGGTTPAVAAANATALSAPLAEKIRQVPSPAEGADAVAPPAANGTATVQASGQPSPQGNATAAATNATLPTGNPGSSAAPSGAGTRPLLASPSQIAPEALKRLIIMASLVEKETAIPAERAQVAGVYANRLRAGMLLQCDPTIIYGVGETFTGSIRRSQLNDAKNRYNTYLHAGLPPGPICSSGFAALEAAMFPARHDLYYFVATGVDGGHTFSRNLNEHNRAVEVYRRNSR